MPSFVCERQKVLLLNLSNASLMAIKWCLEQPSWKKEKKKESGREEGREIQISTTDAFCLCFDIWPEVVIKACRKKEFPMKSHRNLCLALCWTYKLPGKWRAAWGASASGWSVSLGSKMKVSWEEDFKVWVFWRKAPLLKQPRFQRQREKCQISNPQCSGRRGLWIMVGFYEAVSPALSGGGRV